MNARTQRKRLHFLQCTEDERLTFATLFLIEVKLSIESKVNVGVSQLTANATQASTVIIACHWFQVSPVLLIAGGKQEDQEGGPPYTPSKETRAATDPKAPATKAPPLDAIRS